MAISNPGHNYFPLEQYWDAKANITLIGDAAHLMSPSGEGVNTAMLDALDLSNCLTSNEFDNLQDAIASYDNQMRARAVVLAQEALDEIQDFAAATDESINKLVEMLNY